MSGLMTLETKKETKSMTWSLDFFGAGNEIRTRDVNLGKVALYH